MLKPFTLIELTSFRNMVNLKKESRRRRRCVGDDTERKMTAKVHQKTEPQP